MKLFARIGGSRLPKSRQLLKQIGIYPIRDHYYQPLINDKLLRKSLREERNLPGINLKLLDQLKLLERLQYGQELIDLKLNESAQADTEFCIRNPGFASGDAEFLYQIIRHKKPKKIIEIGSGQSTKIACLATKKNSQENGNKATHLCIEPYEQPWLEKLNVQVARHLLEELDISIFQELEAGDLLFIDSSHVIRPQGEVLMEYLEIIPLLKKGVIVHIHDIFTPRDYLDSWIREDVLLWNEQYLLECLLSNTSRYKILASLNSLKHTHYEKLKLVCPYLSKNREPGSFYFEII
ncbi:class I SAM-dependent methyltransferase [Synechococcus sp. MIT S9452]|uniref:class I SAM-dependent methyltransferase n=1 Tax=Synechococcus sp. MIT S9452 TaxID=3082546 RepID=UPI0039A45E57